MSEAHTLAQAESPAKKNMLDLLDRLRVEIEAGDIVTLFTAPVHRSREFSTRSAGDISMLQLITMLEVAKHDAIRRLEPR